MIPACSWLAAYGAQERVRADAVGIELCSGIAIAIAMTAAQPSSYNKPGGVPRCLSWRDRFETPRTAHPPRGAGRRSRGRWPAPLQKWSTRPRANLNSMRISIVGGIGGRGMCEMKRGNKRKRFVRYVGHSQGPASPMPRLVSAVEMCIKERLPLPGGVKVFHL